MNCVEHSQGLRTEVLPASPNVREQTVTNVGETSILNNHSPQSVNAKRSSYEM
jgi:hypothetical protein